MCIKTFTVTQHNYLFNLTWNGEYTKEIDQYGRDYNLNTILWTVEIVHIFG